VSWSIEIVEGNSHLRSLLSWHLQQVGYQVHQAASLYPRGKLKRPPTLVILILNLMVMESSSAGGCSDSNSP